MPQRVSPSRCYPRCTHLRATSARVPRHCSGDRVDHAIAIFEVASSVRKLVARHTTTSIAPTPRVSSHSDTKTERRRESASAWLFPNDCVAQRNARQLAYWTVIVPFIPIARWGVQWNGYWPGLTFASEIV